MAVPLNIIPLMILDKSTSDQGDNKGQSGIEGEPKASEQRDGAPESSVVEGAERKRAKDKRSPKKLFKKFVEKISPRKRTSPDDVDFAALMQGHIDSPVTMPDTSPRCRGGTMDYNDYIRETSDHITALPQIPFQRSRTMPREGTTTGEWVTPTKPHRKLRKMRTQVFERS